MQKPELLRIKSYLDAIVGERNPFSSPDQLKRCGDYIADQFRRFQLTVSGKPVPFIFIYLQFMDLGLHYLATFFTGCHQKLDNTKVINRTLAIRTCKGSNHSR